MKILHLSDLHIGKKVNEFSMLEDQRYILSEILQIIDEEKPNIVLIAGDLYDKTVPSAEAVSLADFFITQLERRSIKTFIISGNHDSAERLAFGSEIMKDQGVFIAKAFDGKLEKITLNDEYGNLNIYSLPFVKPINIKNYFKEVDIKTYDDAIKAIIDNLEMNSKERNIIICHQFIDHAEICDSEERAIGGLDQVSPDNFEAFDYVALGHLHGAQYVKKPEIRYCGTPLKYSFSEKNHKKSVTLVTMREKSDLVEIKTVDLVPKHDMREIRGSFDEIVNGKLDRKSHDDYVKIVLTDEEDIIEGMGKLRQIYPNIMKLEYDNRRTRLTQEVDGGNIDKKLSPLELFNEFYYLQNNSYLDEKNKENVEELIERAWEKK